MIRSIPNPPMGQDDIVSFRKTIEKHLRGNNTPEELQQIQKNKARAKANAEKIISNCGGKNPILGY